MSYTGALGACGRAGEWEVALRLLKEMREDGVPPNAFSYSAASKRGSLVDMPPFFFVCV